MTVENQTKCLVSDQGWKYMAIYDGMPPPIRSRLQSSSHNLCPACLYKHYYITGDWDRAICIVETEISIEERRKSLSPVPLTK